MSSFFNGTRIYASIARRSACECAEILLFLNNPGLLRIWKFYWFVNELMRSLDFNIQGLTGRIVDVEFLDHSHCTCKTLRLLIFLPEFRGVMIIEFTKVSLKRKSCVEIGV